MKNNNKITCEGLIMPNANLSTVTKAALTSSSGNVAVIVGGTNDVLNGDLNYIYKSWEKELAALSKLKPVIVTTIPEIFDTNRSSSKNDIKFLNLIKINNYIRELSVRINNVSLIDLKHLNKVHYSGIHLNKRGKIKLSRLILDIFNDTFYRDHISSNIPVNTSTIMISDVNRISIASNTYESITTPASAEESLKPTAKQMTSGTSGGASTTPLSLTLEDKSIVSGVSDTMVNCVSSGSDSLNMNKSFLELIQINVIDI